MGWSYRKSVNLGPFRVNIGKTGVGYSIGGKGFRTGVRSNGRRYSRFSIPGAGIGYNVSHPSSKQGPATAGCAILFVVLGAGALLVAYVPFA